MGFILRLKLGATGLDLVFAGAAALCVSIIRLRLGAEDHAFNPVARRDTKTRPSLGRTRRKGSL